MRFAGRLLAAAAATFVLSSSAMAADVVIIPPPAPPAPIPIEDPAFAGPYWGVYGGIIGGQIRQGTGPMVGTQFGYNFVANNLRIGAEIETEYYRPIIGPLVDASLNGRIGLVLGGGNVMVYGQAGIGTLSPGSAVWNIGGGVEFALNPGLVLFAEAKRMQIVGGGPVLYSFRGGVNYYADANNLNAAGEFDWGGLYFGVGGGVIRVPGPLRVAGVQVGYNFGGGPLVFGVEVETTHPLVPAPVINASLNGRVGFAFGSFLVYGEIGIGSYLGQPGWTAGGGVELALGERLGIFGEVERIAPLGAGPTGLAITGGLNVHFGH